MEEMMKNNPQFAEAFKNAQTSASGSSAKNDDVVDAEVVD